MKKLKMPGFSCFKIPIPLFTITIRSNRAIQKEIDQDLKQTKINTKCSNAENNRSMTAF